VENPLATKVISGEISAGDHVSIDAAAMANALVIRQQDSDN